MRRNRIECCDLHGESAATEMLALLSFRPYDRYRDRYYHDYHDDRDCDKSHMYRDSWVESEYFEKCCCLKYRRR